MINIIRNNNKIFDILLSSIIIGLLLFVAYYSVPFADDFCKQYNESVLNTIIFLFKTGDGRFLSFSGLFMTLGFKYLSFNQMSVFWLLFFLSSIVLLTKLFENKTKSSVFIYLSVLILVLIGSESYFNEIVFWATGGSVYSVSTFFALLYLYILKRYGINLYILLTGILFTTIGPNYTIPMLVIIVLELIANKQYRINEKLAYSLGFVLIFSLGILLIIFAPGTEQRLGTVSTFWMWHPRFIVEAILRVLFMAFKFYPISVVVMLIVLIVEFYYVFRLKSKNIWNKLFSLIYNLRFLFASLVSILVFIKTPGLLSGRAAYFFLILLILQLLNTSNKLKVINITTPIRVVSILLIFILINTLNNTYVFNKKYNIDLKNKSIEREYLLKNYIYNNINTPFKRTDSLIRDERNIWAEQCFDNYRNSLN